MDGFVSAPDAGIQHIAQYLHIIQYGQYLKSAAALRHHHREHGPARFLEVRRTVSSFQRIGRSVPDIRLYILIGIHKIDKLSQEKTETSQVIRPFILPHRHDLRHHFAKQAGQRIQPGIAGVLCSRPGLRLLLLLRLLKILHQTFDPPQFLTVGFLQPPASALQNSAIE